MKRIAVALLAMTLGTACNEGHDPDPARATAEAIATVESVLTRFSSALSTGNATELEELTSDRFTLLDEGRTYDLPATLSSVHGVLATGTMTRTPREFHTELRGDVAWSHYRVSGEFRGADASLQLALLETAVLERVDDRWQIVLMATLPETH